MNFQAPMNEKYSQYDNFILDIRKIVSHRHSMAAILTQLIGQKRHTERY
jgi:hypothetical protein